MKRRTVVSTLLVVAVLVTFASGFLWIKPIQAYSGIPTFDIVSVTPDDRVTIRTNNFPAGYTFVARMGAFGTLGIGGAEAGRTDSGAGGAFDVTYTIPAALHGSRRIAIRLDSTSGGFFAYNWFDNAAGSSPGEATPTPTRVSSPAPSDHMSGIPTFDIQAVIPDTSVTILTDNFPAGKTWRVLMGPFGTLGIGGTLAETFTAPASGGNFTRTFNIPANMKGSRLVAIRLESTTGGYFSYNWFENKVSASATPAVSPTPTPTSTPVPSGGGTTPTPTSTPAASPTAATPGGGYSGFPIFSISAVVKDQTVTVSATNFPTGRSWRVLMGPFGTRGIGGTLAGTFSSPTGGSFTKTFDIPASMQGKKQIAIRIESATDGYFAYNWFWNNTYP